MKVLADPSKKHMEIIHIYVRYIHCACIIYILYTYIKPVETHTYINMYYPYINMHTQPPTSKYTSYLFNLF